jgi:hypothetical protein
MRNYFMRLYVLCVLFVFWEVFASQNPLFNVAMNEIRNEHKDVIATGSIVQNDNCALVIGEFEKDTKSMFDFVGKLTQKRKTESILVCPNTQCGKTEDSCHLVTALRYKGEVVNACRDTNYQGVDYRLNENSDLVLYCLHTQALRVVPENNQKGSLENSREKHQQELSFLLQNRQNNNKAPVIVLVEKNNLKPNERGPLISAFADKNVEKILDCLQIKQEEEIIKEKITSADKRMFNSLKIVAIPIFILLGYLLYRYAKP